MDYCRDSYFLKHPRKELGINAIKYRKDKTQTAADKEDTLILCCTKDNFVQPISGKCECSISMS